MTPQLKGVLITTLGVLILVPDSLMIRLIDANVFTIIALRSGISCLVMATYCFFISGWKPLGLAALIFIISEAIGTFLFVIALENTSVASTLFLVSTTPLFAAVISWFAVGERLKFGTILTMLGALIGIAVIASGSTDGNPSRLIGDLAALGVAITLGIAFTAVRRAPDIPVVQSLALAYLLATVMGAVVAPTLLLEGVEWLWIIMNGAIFVPLGFALISAGPRYITAPEVSLILLLEAVLAPVLVWFVLDENPGQRVLLGGAIVLVVLLLSNLASLRTAKAQAVLSDGTRL